MSENDKIRPSEAAASDAETPAETETKAPSPEDRIAALEAEVADLRDRLLREMAEMENLRKRSRRETEDAARYAVSSFARDLVTVADDLRRALAAVPEEARAGGDEVLTGLIKGLEVTERSFEQTLERHGIKRFSPQGERFNPALHEAMFEVPDESVPAGTVAHVAEDGYMIGERVLRPARVGVSKGGPKAAPSEPQDAEASRSESGEGAGSQSDADDSESFESRAADSSESEPSQSAEAQPGRIGIKVDRSA